MKTFGAQVTAILFLIAAFFTTILLVYSDNLSSFGHLGIAEIAPTILRATWLPILFVVAATILLSYLRLGRLAQAILIFSATYIAMTGLVFPVPVSTAGMTNIASLAVSWPNVYISAGIALLVAGAWLTPLRSAVAFGLTVLLASTAALAAWPVLSRARSVDMTDMSSTKNVFVLSFDGLQSDLMAKAISETPNQLQDFTFFVRAMGISPATNASIGAEVGGNFDYKAVAKAEKDLMAYIKPHSTPNLLARNGWQVRTFGNYANYFSGAKSSSARLQGAASNQRESEYLANTALARIGGPHLQLSPPTLDEVAANDPIAAGAARHKAPNWKVPFVLSKNVFDNYVTGLRVATDDPVIHFLHFTFTHHPVDFDHDCSYRSDDEKWYKNIQTTAGLYGESVCAVKSYDAFLDRLKALGVYDDALIILKSDHGQPADYNTDDELPARNIRGHTEWGMGRYMPFLAVKAPGQHYEAIRFDHRYFALSDLATTLCNFANAEGCDSYHGFDLLDEASSPSGDLYVNIVSGPESDFKFDTHETIHVQRGDIASVLAPHEAPAKGVSTTCPDCLALPSEGLAISGETHRKPFKEGWSGLSKHGVWTTSESSTLKIENSSGAKNITLDFAPYLPNGAVKDVSIVVDGREVFSKNFTEPSNGISQTFEVSEDAATIELTFSATPLFSPSKFGPSKDTRELGILLKSIKLH